MVVSEEKNEVEENFICLHSSSDIMIETEQLEVQEDFIHLSSSSEFVIESEQNEINISITKPSEANNKRHSAALTKVTVDDKNSSQGKEDVEIEGSQVVQTMELDNDSDEGFILVDTINKANQTSEVGSSANTGNGCILVQNNHSTIRNHGGDESSILGVKRARMTYVDQEPSVHVEYKSLARVSKRKLEELLQQWSQWHAQQNFSTNDPSETLESGEQTLFPALHYGLEKASTVSFWMDNQTRKEEYKFTPLDGDSVPMYDRGFAVGLTTDDGSTKMEGVPERLEASRCFNCGSYSHGLKDCQRPRDNAAVESARKQYNSKRVQSAGSRNSSRYYEDTPGGKYDGIRPGVLSSEARKLLGLGELDPPPWLHRMREIGYPPGYLDPDYEDEPSGITIYAADEKPKTTGEEELLGTNNPEPKKKMTVEFPGINAPIPENADERRWASLSEISKRSDHIPIPITIPSQIPIPIPMPIAFRSSEKIDMGNYSDPRRPRDDGPPGCTVGVESPRYGNYAPNYGNNSYSPRGQLTPILGRSLSDRGRWSPQVHLGSPIRSPYSPVTNYGSPNALMSPPSYNSPRPESWAYGGGHHRPDHHHLWRM